MSGIALSSLPGPIWMDGVLVDAPNATLHVLSHGLHNASCVFEGIRVYGGRGFALHEHYQRLHRSAKALGFVIPFTESVLARATAATLGASQLDDAYVRPIAWRGSETIGISGLGTSVHVAIAALPWGRPLFQDRRERGIRLQVARWARPAPNTAPIQAKASCHYVISTLSYEEAVRAGFDDALLLDYRGMVAEATGANVFAVSRGTICTPPTECALDGITRQVVMRLMRQQRLEVVVRPLTLDELCASDEVFLTGTAVEVLPVAQVGDHRFSAEPQIASRCARLYAEAVLLQEQA